VVTTFHQKKIGIEYEHQSSIHNPEQDKILSDFSEQTRAGLTHRGLSFPDMLKGTRRNTLDHEEQHFLESATDKSVGRFVNSPLLGNDLNVSFNILFLYVTALLI